MKISKEVVERWAKTTTEWLAENYPQYTRETIKTGRDAWTIAHRAGLTREAYDERLGNDAHIQTALEAIFPNAVFKDKKVY